MRCATALDAMQAKISPKLVRQSLDIIITAGQSNFANFYTVLNVTPPDLAVSCRGYTANQGFRNAYDPQLGCDGSASSVFPVLGNLITARTSRELGIISLAVSNSRISSWAQGGANYSRFASALQYAPQASLLCVLFHNGETDSAFSVTQADYETGLKSMIDGVRASAGWQVPFGIARATHPNNVTGAGVRAAQQSIGSTYAGCFLGADTDTLNNTYRTDGVHFNSTTGRNAHASLWYDALLAANILLPTPAPPFNPVLTSKQGLISTRSTGTLKYS